jgi:hypothetical protein
MILILWRTERSSNRPTRKRLMVSGDRGGYSPLPLRSTHFPGFALRTAKYAMNTVFTITSVTTALPHKLPRWPCEGLQHFLRQ